MRADGESVSHLREPVGMEAIGRKSAALCGALRHSKADHNQRAKRRRPLGPPVTPVAGRHLDANVRSRRAPRRCSWGPTVSLVACTSTRAIPFASSTAAVRCCRQLGPPRCAGAAVCLIRRLGGDANESVRVDFLSFGSEIARHQAEALGDAEIKALTGQIQADSPLAGGGTRRGPLSFPFLRVFFLRHPSTSTTFIRIGSRTGRAVARCRTRNSPTGSEKGTNRCATTASNT